ncbi:MAG TPA: universal stress protein [Ktedonobacterales bacterium]|jgi:nucleotide-binding universal stress UspA family protein
MFLRIFVPLDGSPRAERALGLAALLAQQTPVGERPFEPLLILFRAVDLSPWLDLDDREEARVRATEAAARYLEKQAQCLRDQGMTVETAPRVGNPAEAILEQTMARQVELIVMATHGRSGLARWALGSVAERVARSAPVPLFLLPDAAPATTLAAEVQQTGAMPQILVPLDGSTKAEAALPPAIEMARLLHAEIRLLYVFVPKFEENSLEVAHRAWDAGRRRVHQIERYLMRQAERIKRAGVNAHWTFGYGMPGAKIIEAAHSRQVSLMVMTTQGRGGFVRWRLGSVTEEVLHNVRLPVLLVPSAQVEAQLPPEAQGQETLAKETLR